MVANGDTPTPTPVYLGTVITGTVFEDYNYGGGAGRNQATSGGIGVEGTRVELYSDLGAYLNFTTTDASGNYVFTTTTGTNSLAASTTYQIRVVNSSVVSTRPGSVNSLLSVQTFRTDAATATLSELTNRVGGEQPDEADYGSRTTALPLSATSATQEIQSLTQVVTPASGPRLGIDFGFNFSTIVNTNDTGQGSLRQFITNSNTLTNAGLDQVAFNGTVATGTVGTDPAAGVETSIFMLNDGRATGAPAGLRNGLAAPAGYNATTGFTFTPASALPTVTDSNTALDGNKQANLTGNKVAAVTEVTTGPEVTINFNAQAGLLVTGGNTLVASVGLNNADGGGNQQGSGLTFNTAGASGSTVRDVTATGNLRAGVRIEGGVANVSVLNNVLNNNTNRGTLDADGLELLGTTNATVTGNVLNGNRGYGIFMTTAANTGATIADNFIRNNGTGTSTADAGISIGAASDNNTFRRNTITGNTGDGIIALTGASGNVFTQNSTSGNTNLGIDLSATADVNGDNVSLNANGKTSGSGANGLLNFPVLTQAVTTAANGNLQITGFAPAGSVLEFFLSDKTTDGFGQGRSYLFSTTEGASMPAASNGTTAVINDVDARFGSYSGTINGFDQGTETGATRFSYVIALSTLTASQRSALTTGGARLTATATIGGNTTSEFSGNILIAQSTPLPVELKAFEATAANASALLTWSTASEKSNDHFDVERSFNGVSFEQIGQVQGRGTTSQTTSYSFTDANVGRQHSGVVYYRLQQVDTDGTASYSPVRTVSFAVGVKAGTAAVGVYPNPATSQDRTVTLALTTLPAGTYTVTVLDATGRVVRTQAMQGGQDQLLNVQQLPTGMYLVQVRGNALNLTQRFNKQ